MQYRTLGRTGIEVSCIGLGCMTFGDDGVFGVIGGTGRAEARMLVNEARLAGVTLFDTAADYSKGVSEAFLGEAVRACRSQVVLCTKVCSSVATGGRPVDLSARNIRASCLASLGRLGTDYVDVLYLHNPDPRTPLMESVDALEDLCRDGLVRAYGFSNFSRMRLLDVAPRVWGSPRFAGLQNSYSWMHRDVEQDLIPDCARREVPMVCWSALAGGALTGKYGSRLRPVQHGRYGNVCPPERYASAEASRRLGIAIAQAAQEQRSLSTLALEFVLGRRPPVAAALIGARTPAQLRCVLSAFERESREGRPMDAFDVDSLSSTLGALNDL